MKKELEPLQNQLTEDGIVRDENAVIAAAPVPDFSHYRDLEFIGQGGMARVYRAFDTSLGRMTALKFLRDYDPETAQRLLFEARAQARIEHENVCKVYETGEEGGKPFVAMQFIEGQTLAEVSKELTLDQKVQVMKMVCEGVHAAHRAGLIHRDIKPGNILVERSEEGIWKPFVTDFGLARDINSIDGQTVTGMLLGTPVYMSPEQAMGEARHLDRRTDVYSLGVTLYQILCGQFPYDAPSSAELFSKILNDDPVPLIRRDPSLPQDLNNVVMKCLERQPSARYDSARALAEDLQRYLNGEPVTARPVGSFSVLIRKARRHRLITALLMIAVALVLSFGFIAWKTGRQSEEQARHAQSFGQDISQIESVMRYSYMLPLHDTRNERNVVKRKMESIHLRMKQFGKTAAGPGEYALGRGYLALQEYGEARKHLDKAMELGYQTPEVSYALGRSLGGLYLTEVKRASSIADDSERKRTIELAQKKYRAPALLHLHASRDAVVDSPQYLQALIQFYDNHYDLALSNADEAFRKVPWLYEASVLKGDIYMQMSKQKSIEGRLAVSDDLTKKAEAAYTAALKTSSSNTQAYNGLCEVYVETMIRNRDVGEDVNPPAAKAIEFCRQSLVSDPDSINAHELQATVYRVQADTLSRNDKDPGVPAQKAIFHAKKVLSRDPRNTLAHRNTSLANIDLAEFLILQRLDASVPLNDALLHAKKSAELSPTSELCYNILGIAYRLQSEFAMQSGHEAFTAADQSIRALNRAIQLNPRFAYAYSNMGLTLMVKAQAEKDSGVDTGETYTKAIQNFRTMLQMNPNIFMINVRMAGAMNMLGLYKAEQGFDPSSHFKEAIAICERSSGNSIREGHAARVTQAWAYVFWAESDILDNEDRERYAALAESYARKIDSNSDWYWDAVTASAHALYLRATSNPPPASANQWLLKAEKMIDDPDNYQIDADTRVLLARIRMQSAALDPSRGSALDQAQSNLEEAARLRPRSPQPYLRMAELRLLRAARSKNSSPDLLNALELLKKAEALNHSNASIYMMRYLVLRQLLKTGANPQDAVETMNRSLAEATRLNPKIETRFRYLNL